VNTLLSSAIKVVDMPEFFMIQGKYLAPDVFFSSALSEGPAMWLSQSISHRLFGGNMLNLKLVCTNQLVAGVKVENITVASNVSADASDSMASALLLTAEAASIIAAPAINTPGIDYANFILRFRDSIKSNFKNGDIIKPDHPALGRVMEESVAALNNTLRNGVSPQKPGR